MEQQVLFREDQHFRGLWLWIVFAASAVAFVGLVGAGLLRFMSEGPPWAERPINAYLYVAMGALLIVAYAGVIAAVFAMKLQVEVTTQGLFIRFVPFHRRVRQIDLTGVAKIEAVTYRPIREYGGYGIRYRGGGKAYNVHGDKGVRIHWANDYHLLIGTQHPDELYEALKQITPIQTV